MKSKKTNAKHTKKSKEIDNMKFEDIESRIEEIIKDLQEGNLTIEENMALYREGRELVDRAQKGFDTLNKEIKILSEEE